MIDKLKNVYPIAIPTERVSKIVAWHKNELRNPDTLALRIPAKDTWKNWDDNRLWCSFFFSIVSPGGSTSAREYLKLIEDGTIEFELNPKGLSALSDKDRMKALWTFGTGSNFINKRLGRFFSKPERVGSKNSLESRLFLAFSLLSQKGFMSFFEKLDELTDDREKAKALEFLPGSKLKVSRDFLNNIGMTDNLIPLDIHALGEMAGWGWNVPTVTPSDRETYERIEDAIRLIANELECTVVGIDKAIFSSRIATKKSGKKTKRIWLC
jgi:hypothetical protein